MGELFAELLRHCAIDAAAPTASQQTHLQSLLAALAPSLLWPAPRQAVPKLERPQAVAATRHLLHYYAQRLEYQHLAASSPSLLRAGSAPPAPAPMPTQAPAPAPAPPASPPRPALEKLAALAGKKLSPVNWSEVGLSPCANGDVDEGAASAAGAAAAVSPNGRGKALAMDSARSAIERMFAQEFCVGEAPPARPARDAELGTPAKQESPPVGFQPLGVEGGAGGRRALFVGEEEGGGGQAPGATEAALPGTVAAPPSDGNGEDGATSVAEGRERAVEDGRRGPASDERGEELALAREELALSGAPPSPSAKGGGAGDGWASWLWKAGSSRLSPLRGAMEGGNEAEAGSGGGGGGGGGEGEGEGEGAEALHVLGAARREAGETGEGGEAAAAALPSVQAAATGPHEGVQQPEPAVGMPSFYEASSRETPQQPFLSQTVREAEAEGKGEGEEAASAAAAGMAPDGVGTGGGTGGGELGTEARWMQLGRGEVTRLGAQLEAERTQLQRQLEHRQLEPSP